MTDEARRHVIQVRVSEAEKIAIEDLAAEARMPMSEFVRSRCLKPERNKIVAGLEDAVAHARGDESRASVSAVRIPVQAKPVAWSNLKGQKK